MFTLWGSTMSIGPVREMPLKMSCLDKLIQVCCARISSLCCTKLSRWLLRPRRPSRRRLICRLLNDGLCCAKNCATLMCISACAYDVALAHSSEDAVGCIARGERQRVSSRVRRYPVNTNRKRLTMDQFIFWRWKRNRLTLLIDTQLCISKSFSICNTALECRLSHSVPAKMNETLQYYYIYVGAFVTWRNHMRLLFADCRVSGVVHTRALRNCARESLQWAALFN